MLADVIDLVPDAKKVFTSTSASLLMRSHGLSLSLSHTHTHPHAWPSSDQFVPTCLNTFMSFIDQRDSRLLQAAVYGSRHPALIPLAARY
jgi:hypothetical protein